MELKTFTVFIITMMVLTSVHASGMDDGLKKQCQHIVHGNGSPDAQYNAYLLGVISGIQYMTIRTTDFGEISSYTEKRNEACKNAFNLFYFEI